MAATTRAQRVKLYQHFVEDNPVVEKTVFYHAYRTQIMSCSPFAIFKNLVEDEAFAGWRHIWVYGDEGVLSYDTFTRFAGLDNVEYVEAGSAEHMKALATCSHLITNAALPDYWLKRPGQTVINTWHGTPLKALGRDARDFKSSAIGNAQRNFLLCDYLVMPNRYTAERLLSSYDIEGIMAGKVLDVGSPRGDLVLNTDPNRIRSLLEDKIGESLEGKKVVLYAPTFRSEGGSSVNTTETMAKHMLEMSAKLPDDYVLFFKAHNTLSEFFSGNRKMGARLIFDEIETNELLSAVDVLITDYSSIFFDFICTGRPILFFDYDKDDYVVKHGLYLDMESMPGVECFTVDAVVDQIRAIAEGSFAYPNRDSAIAQFAYRDDGHATQRVVDIIFKDAKPGEGIIKSDRLLADDRTSVLVSLGSKLHGSSAQILTMLMRELDPATHRITIATRDISLIWKECEKLHPDVRILFYSFNFEGADPDSENDSAARYRELYRAYFPGMGFNVYYDLKRNEGFIDRMLRGAGAIGESIWMLTWSNTMKVSDTLRRRKRFDRAHLFCAKEEELPARIRIAPFRIIPTQMIRQDPHHRMTTLIIAGNDSTNYQLSSLALELKARGHDAIVLVNSMSDTGNNLAFLEHGIQLMPRSTFDIPTLDFVDLVIGSPIRFASFNRIYKEITDRMIPTCAFATLFSSVAMRIRPDFLFTLGHAKLDELAENHLQYNCIETGNPQYDSLVAMPRKNDGKPIKNVLFLEQGGYPYGKIGKQQVADTLVRIAQDNPDIEFDIKYRYLPNSTGKTMHTVSDHLHDFLGELPPNLKPIMASTILEDIIGEYDAMITMWSTAYLDALMLDMPLILIDGFDTVDVFDVRVGRVNDAYEHLKATGCLYHFEDMRGDIREKFRTVDGAYVANEIYEYRTPSAPRVVDLLEFIYERLVLANKRISEHFTCTAAEFSTLFENFELTSADDAGQILRTRYLNAVNNAVQEYVYQNRCMGSVLDLTPLDAYFKADLADLAGRDPEKVAEQTRTLLAEEFLAIRTRFFDSPEGIELVERDRILQDFYFDWLYESGRYDEIRKPVVKLLTPESREYNLALIDLDALRISSAYGHLFKFVDLASNQEVNQLLKCKRMKARLQPFKDKGRLYLFYLELLKKDNAHLIEYLFDNPERNALVALRYAHAMNEAGDYEACVVFCDLAHLRFTGKGKTRNTIGKTVVLYEKKILHRALMRERERAMAAIKSGA